jgi:hypothetical protein
MDHVRGRHSFRTGIEVAGTRYRSDQESNYLGTYYFESPQAFAEGRPRSFTKRIGDPNIRYTNTQVSLYFQDDIRLSKTLTMTPGVRYEVQTHVKDYNNVMPRFGVTWAPAGGKTTYRASLGIFYDWLSTGIYQQTLQFDGFRMQEVNLATPQYPDPGPLGAAPAVNRYLLSEDLVLPRTARASLGISRTVNSMMSVNGVTPTRAGFGQFVGETSTRRQWRASRSGLRQRHPRRFRRQDRSTLRQRLGQSEPGWSGRQPHHRTLVSMAARSSTERLVQLRTVVHEHRRRLRDTGHRPAVRMGSSGWRRSTPDIGQHWHRDGQGVVGIHELRWNVGPPAHHPHRL